MKKEVVFGDKKETIDVTSVNLSMPIGIEMEGERYALVQVGSVHKPNSYVGKLSPNLMVYDTSVYISERGTTSDLQGWLSVFHPRTFVFDTNEELIVWLMSGK